MKRDEPSVGVFYMSLRVENARGGSGKKGGRRKGRNGASRGTNGGPDPLSMAVRRARGRSPVWA